MGGRWYLTVVLIHISLMISDPAYICTAESLCCSPETITALLTGSTPIQNNKFNKKEKEREKIKTNKK